MQQISLMCAVLATLASLGEVEKLARKSLEGDGGDITQQQVGELRLTSP